MKKILALLFVMYLSSSLVNAEVKNGSRNIANRPPMMSEAEIKQRETAFEQRLGLTEAQKQQAKNLRQKGQEEIKPVIYKIKAREQEIRILQNSDTNSKAQEEKIQALHLELRELHKQAHDIRVENMKDFENILSSEQKKTLKDMKHEGRQEFHRKRMPVKK